MKIAICDNEEEQVKIIRDALIQVDDECEIDEFTNIDEFFDSLEKNKYAYNAVLMDLDWDNKDSDGTDYSSQLFKINKSVRVICVSAYTMDYIEKLYYNMVNIFGVINKPIDIVSLRSIYEKLIKDIEKSKETFLVKDRDGIYYEKTRDIVYALSDGHNVNLIKEDSIRVVHESFRKACSKLPKHFYVINKGISVNMEHVKRIDNGEVVVGANEIKLPIGRNKIKIFKEKFFEYLRTI